MREIEQYNFEACPPHNSSTTRVAHLRNCTARSELTLYPTAMMVERL
jgi:hypothetical protein